MPLISILIPSKNSLAYYSECIISALNQTISDIEVLCIDAMSDDGTRQLIEETVKIDGRVRLINAKKASYGYQINRGIKEATGAYIMILESDDYLELDALDYYLGLLEKHNLDFVRSDHDLFKGEGANRTFTRRILTTFKGYYNKVMNPSQTVECMYLTNLMQSGMFRRAFLLEKNIMLHETPGASYQDAGFWWQTYTQAERAMFTKEIKYHLRRDNPNSSVLSKDKVFAICDEYDFIHDYLIRNKLNQFLPMCAKRRFDNYQWNAKRIGDWHRPAFFERFAKDFRKLRDNNELDRAYFSPRMWNRLEAVMHLGAAYYWNDWHYLKKIDTLKASNKKLTTQINAQKEKNRTIAKEAAKQKKLWRDALIEAEKELITIQHSKEYQRALEHSSRMVQDQHALYRSKLQDLDEASSQGKRKRSQVKSKAENPFSGILYKCLEEGDNETLARFLPMICSKRKGLWPNLYKPRSYTEIAICRRLRDPFHDKKAYYSDIFNARSYAQEVLGSEHVEQFLATWDKPSEFFKDELPNSFAVCCNQSSEAKISIFDKRLILNGDVQAQLKKWTYGNFAYLHNYNLYQRDIKKRFYAEELLLDDHPEKVVSFWYFNSELRFIQISGTENHIDKCSCFDPQGELMLFSLAALNHDHNIDASAHIERLGSKAESLALDVDHCIIIFRKGQDGAYRFYKYSFGSCETFAAWRPTRADYLVGDYWDITSRK